MEIYKECLGTADTNIYVAIHGNDDRNDGTFDSPFLTISHAVSKMTATRNTVVIMPGEYTLDDAIDVSIDGGKIIGLGEVVINGGSGKDYCFKTVMPATSGTKDFTFKNLTINHEDDATQVGIQLQNTSMTAKLNVYMSDCEFNSDGGNSVDIDHAATGNAIRLYANRCAFEGPVNMVVADGGDRLRLTDCIVRGGLVTDAGDYDGEILLNRCLVLHEGVTGGHSNQRAITINCATETDADPNVYALLDTADLAGSHAEQIIGS
jgi:hypothetical protein